MVFLLGPPGAGKSTLGRRACRELGIRFLDLAASRTEAHTTELPSGDLARLDLIVADRSADVIELPWSLQEAREALVTVRKLGSPLVLWAHPLDMQARSGRDEQLFTPVPRLKLQGGFGRHGTSCREYRHLHRACGEALLLVGLSVEEAADVVTERIEELRSEHEMTPAQREGLTSWIEDWRCDHDANQEVSSAIVDAMARYLTCLGAAGRSARTIAAIRSDLNAAGHLVLMYDASRRGSVMRHFASPPHEFEFRRKFTDNPNAVARYRRSLDGFARFLRESGAL